MRIRSIRPEFWRSDDITALDRDDRLLFIGLWSYVDDNGVGLDKLADITADLFAGDLERDPPETFARVSRGLARLSEGLLITRYEVAGRGYLHITNWHKHQRIDKPGKQRYPLPTSEDAVIRETLARVSRDFREPSTPGEGEKGRRGEGEKETCSPAPPSSETELAVVDSNDYPDTFEEFWHEYPRKAGKRKALAAWKRAIRRVGNDTLIRGAIRYAQDPNRIDQYTKYAEGWLNADGWLDEPLPGRNQLATNGASRADQKVQGWLDIGARLTSRNEPKGIA